MVTEEEKLLKLMCSLQTHLVSPKEKKMHQEVISFEWCASAKWDM